MDLALAFLAALVIFLALMLGISENKRAEVQVENARLRERLQKIMDDRFCTIRAHSRQIQYLRDQTTRMKRGYERKINRILNKRGT